MGYAAGKSCAGEVGEKLFRVVGFGAFSESGGLVLGFKIGGESGRGIRFGKCCFVGPAVVYILPICQVALVGGDSGIVTEGYESFLGLTGFDLSGLGNAGFDMALGDGGGEGVDSDEKNVGPCSVEDWAAASSGNSEIAFSTALLDCLNDSRSGRGDAIAVLCFSGVAKDAGLSADVGKNYSSQKMVMCTLLPPMGSLTSRYKTVPFLKHSGSLL